MNMTELLLGIVRVKRCSVKDEKGGVSKPINLTIDYSDCSIEDILTKAVAHDVIAWQNGQGRKNYASLIAGQNVTVKASRPGAAPQLDPKEAYIARLMAMTPEARAKEFADLQAKATK